MPFSITSTEFQDGGILIRKYTCDDKDISPPLEWEAIPSGTKSFTLICDDPDAPSKTWVHWVLFNIPSNERTLDERIPPENELPNGSIQGINDFGKIGYGGPCPPPGDAHRYIFKLYALDTLLELKSGATKAEVEEAIKGHILGESKIMCKYKRK